MRFGSLLPAAILCVLASGVAQAQRQHLSSEELDRLAVDRHGPVGPRDWGPPPAVSGSGVKVAKPTPEPVECKSPATDFEPLYSEPRASSAKIGTAAPQIAATNDVRSGWRKILRSGTSFAWIPDVDVVAFRPLVAGAKTRCVVTGEGSNGMVLFTHPAE